MKANQKRAKEWTICKDVLEIKKLKVEVSGSAKPLYVGSNPGLPDEMYRIDS